MSHYENIKNFIIEWHILLILILGLVTCLSLISLVIWKLKKIKISYVFIFIFGLIFSLMFFYWITTEEVRLLYLGYFLYYATEYLSKTLEYSFFMFKSIIFLIPNMIKIISTCTPYEQYIFAGEYWTAIKLCSYDSVDNLKKFIIWVTVKLGHLLVEGPTYRLTLIETNNWNKFFYDNFFLN